ncbi:uncharacterized protein LOC136026663 [Artemia franciscana]|uniref:uncharacterized protein LOC136026663 n=1 Tax=Artemia franciscana TaxID=6661 RepID=UPI0032DB81D8
MALLGGSKCLVRSVYASLQRHQVLKLGGSNREGATVSGFDRSADSYQSKSQKKKKKKLYAEVIEVTDGSARNRKKKLKKANATSILGNQMNENATPEELLQEIDQGRAPLPAHLEELEEVLEFESRESVKEESTDFKKSNKQQGKSKKTKNVNPVILKEIEDLIKLRKQKARREMCVAVLDVCVSFSLIIFYMTNFIAHNFRPFETFILKIFVHFLLSFLVTFLNFEFIS